MLATSQRPCLCTGQESALSMFVLCFVILKHLHDLQLDTLETSNRMTYSFSYGGFSGYLFPLWINQRRFCLTPVSKDSFSKARKSKTSLHFPISLYCDACNCIIIMSGHVRTVPFASLSFMSREPKLPSYPHSILMIL